MNFIPHREYKKILENIPIVCTDILVLNGDRFLLVKRNKKPAKGVWWLPGGRILKGEHLEDAVKRKVREETGLNVNVEKQIGTYETIFDDGPFENMDSGVHSVNVCYLVKCVDENPELKIDHTSLEYGWFDRIEKFFPEYVKTVLSDSGIFSV